MERVQVTHQEYRNVANGHDGARMATQRNDIRSWVCQLDGKGMYKAPCKECRVLLRVCRLSDKEFLSKRRTLRRDGVKMTAFGVLVWPFGVMACLTASSLGSFLGVVLFIVGVLVVVFTTAATIGGIVAFFSKPKRYIVEYEGEPHTQPTQGWRVIHKAKLVN